MVHPSYSELMDKINSEADKDNMIESRYSIVMAAADRAREIIESRSIEEKIAKQLKNDPTATPELKPEEKYNLENGRAKIPGSDSRKPLSVAIDELYKGEVKINLTTSHEDE